MAESVRVDRILADRFESDDIRSFFERGFEKRIYNPLESSLATDLLSAQIEAWRRGGDTIVFTSGVYDLFHANHRTFLLHTKLAAMPYHYQSMYGHSDGMPSWDELSSQDRTEFCADTLARDSLRLVVSVDGNATVAERKGCRADKGGAPRPIYDWITRARDVLSAGFETADGTFRRIADAVTLHDNCEPSLSNSPHAGIMEIAEFVAPNVWSVFCESEDITNALTKGYAVNFADTEVRVLGSRRFYSDRLIGGPFSTTAVSKRIGGLAFNGGGKI